LEQVDLLRRVVEVLEEQGLEYFLVGSLASAVYGQPRLTHDIDVVVSLAADQVERLCMAFPTPEYYVSMAAAQEAVARRGQFNVIHPASGNKLDFLLSRRDAWGQIQMSRRRREEILPGRVGYVAAPEDVILGKLLYYRAGGSEKHLRDVAAMLQVSGAEIDQQYVAQWAVQLGVGELWQVVRARHQDRVC